jgi:hypothetical protein
MVKTEAGKGEGRDEAAFPGLGLGEPTMGYGNPAHIAKVHEMLKLQAESLVDHVPDAMRYAYAVGRPANRDPFSWLLALTSSDVDSVWRAWRATLSERLDLSGADFSNRAFQVFDFRDARMLGTSFRGAWLFVCIFDGADLSGARFEGAHGQGLSFKAANLRGSSFAGAELFDLFADGETVLDGADFSRCRLKKSTGRSADDDLERFKKLLSPAQRKQLAGRWF